MPVSLDGIEMMGRAFDAGEWNPSLADADNLAELNRKVQVRIIEGQARKTWTMNDEFREAMMPHAEHALRFKPLAAWAVEKAVLESAGGRSIPGDSFNVLGYKATGNAPYVSASSDDWTGANSHGRREVRFRKFSSFSHCFNQFAYALFESRHYFGAFTKWILEVERIWCPRPGHPVEILGMVQRALRRD